MTRHVVIGTAGHVDHGKTALVKALTGVDTDRFPEEQRRGITIDIGFAPLALDGDTQASIVDVPGHEDFIRNMVAGATGIDLALLVVAADEGVMPQTLEHLAILELLGVRGGVVAITKADLADPDWLDLVRADVSERLRRTPIRWEPPTAVSVVNGSGLAELRDRLASAATLAVERASGDLFRMPVDRVFSLAGAGTVITGTTWSGAVKVGDTVSVLPEGVSGRVRSIEVHGARRDAAQPGRRTALALTGVERTSVGRGSVAVSSSSWRATTSLDVMLSLLPDAPRAITQRARIRLHLGTAEVIARVTPGSEEIGPGESGVARLRLEEPVVARWGDRGVIRAYSPVATVGGCVVFDPWPAARPRRPADAGGRVALEPVERIRAFALSSGSDGIGISELTVRAGVDAAGSGEAVKRAIEDLRILRLGDRLYPAGVLADLTAKAVATLEEYHRAHQLSTGMPLELLRQAVRPVTLSEHVLAGLVESNRVVLGGGFAKLASHAPSLTEEQEAAGGVLLRALTASGSEGKAVEELNVFMKSGSARELAEYYVRQGTVIRVGTDRYYERAAFERLSRAALSEILRGKSSPAQLRDALKLTRKYLIPLLEWLDLKGLTVRVDDTRQVTPAGSRYLRDGA